MRASGVGISYIPPGTPWNNGHIESFNESARSAGGDRRLQGAATGRMRARQRAAPLRVVRASESDKRSPRC
ncbi:integrase core domain-containing protein [Rhodococcus marinonascens]|uniref:integrase core domain-containing protein n=1 Tax=Rhodococcus marinonascens TaxID=38311 RepID=UPI001114B194